MVYIECPNTINWNNRYTYTSTEQSLWKIGLRKVTGIPHKGFAEYASMSENHLL